jgi:hypothetical protein
MKEMLDEIIEVDETYIGGKEPNGIGTSQYIKKVPVMALVERQGNVRSFPFKRITLANIEPVPKEPIAQDAKLTTGESTVYGRPKKYFATHDTMNPRRGEYSQGVNGLTITNPVERCRS